jgi:hypothetical protein
MTQWPDYRDFRFDNILTSREKEEDPTLKYIENINKKLRSSLNIMSETVKDLNLPQLDSNFLLPIHRILT